MNRMEREYVIELEEQLRTANDMIDSLIDMVPCEHCWHGTMCCDCDEEKEEEE